MRINPLWPWVLILWGACAATVFAQAPTPDQESAPTRESPPDTLATHLPDLIVVPLGMPWGDQPVPGGVLRRAWGESLAETLEQLPGISAVRRSADAAEPVIRGLGWERVQTFLGAVPLYGACPGHMDPPATYLESASLQRVDVYRGAEGGLMPGAVGGMILADPHYERPAGAADRWRTFVNTGYGTARDAYHLDTGVYGGRGRLDVRASVGVREASDYTSPEGTVVPADASHRRADLSVGWNATEDARLWTAFTYAHDEDLDFPALPMDAVSSDFLAGNAGWRWRRPGSGWTQVSVTAGFSTVDHLMDNSLKPTAAVMQASTDTDARSWGAHVQAVRDDDSVRWTLGLDGTGLTRDANRTRTMMGTTYRDHLWPDARQVTYGASARAVINPSGVTRWALTGRLDGVDSRARAVDDPSLQGMTIGEQWVGYFGSGAENPDRTEAVGAAAVQVDRVLGEGVDGYLRTGVGARAAGVTERYYAFAPAPGGYQLGNPTLDPEKKHELEAGLAWIADAWAVRAAVFGSWFSDYILPEVIDSMDVNGDGSPDAIKGFVPVDARLYGGELTLQWRPSEVVRLPLAVSWVRGENTSDHRDLPEIPPLSGYVELRIRGHAVTQTWISARCDFAADQNHVDPLFVEDSTPGYAVWGLGLDTEPMAGLTVSARLENIFDREYHEHLVREAVLPVGGLAKGQEIPAVGRNLRLAARWVF